MLILTLLLSQSLCLWTKAKADLVSIPNVFVAGQTLPASKLNQNFSVIYNGFNGNITNDNIASDADIDMTKISFDATAFMKLASGNNTWASGITGDTEPRITMTSDGLIAGGPGGSTAPDISFRRQGSKTFQLYVPGGMSTGTLDINSGALANVGQLTPAAGAATAYQMFRENAGATGIEAVEIVAGSNMTITPGAGTLTFASSGGGGGGGGGDVSTSSTNVYTGSNTQDVSASGQSLRIPLKSTPGSPQTGEIYIDGANLEFRDNAGSPANKVVVDTARTITAGTGLTGGGDLSTNRTISLSAPVSIANGGTGTTTAPGNGKLLIGTNAGGYAVANLTQGSGISISNGDGTITIAATGGGGAAPANGPYITWGSSGALSDYKTLSATSGLSLDLNPPGGHDAVLSAVLSSQNINSNVPIATSTMSLCDASSGNLSLTFPAVISANMFKPFYVTRVDNSSNSVTITTVGSDTINGGTTYTLGATTQYKTTGFMCIGSNKIIILGEYP